MEDKGNFNDTTTDARLGAPGPSGVGTNGDGPFTSLNRESRKDAVEFAIRGSSGRTLDAAKIVKEAQVIYDYIFSGTLPEVDKKDKSNFTTTTPRGQP